MRKRRETGPIACQGVYWLQGMSSPVGVAFTRGVKGEGIKQDNKPTLPVPTITVCSSLKGFRTIRCVIGHRFGGVS